MTELIEQLFSRIDTIGDLTDETTLTKVAEAWLEHRDMQIVREGLLQWLETTVDIGQLRTAARETSTHYVWPLYLGGRGYSVTINEFKDPDEIVKGHANTLHNHRYSFVSLVLSGGYKQIRSEIDFINPTQVVQIRDLGEDIVAEGSVTTVNHTDFHRLLAIKRRTVTLIVKCPAAKKESLSVDTGTLRVVKHIPVEARVRQLLDTLAPRNDQRR
ncbi:MAG: hypothetical protein JO016_13120 [Actinobacteria bacterium]|nr:hypothetical protein [Actinomycetota bacterium]